MRILMLGIALLALTCSAFAAGSPPPQDDSATVSLTLAPWVDVDITQAALTMTVGGDDPESVLPAEFKSPVLVTTNCPWTLSVLTNAALAGSNGGSLAAIPATFDVSTGGPTSGGTTVNLTATYVRKGLVDVAGTYAGSVTVRVVSP